MGDCRILSVHRLPAGIGYPLFLACRWAVTHDGHQKKVKATTEDKIYAYLIPCLLALFLFLLFLIPLFIRKYVVRLLVWLYPFHLTDRRA